MTSEDWLDVLRSASIVAASILLFFSLIAVGRHAGDLEYQKRAKINGIRKLQSIDSIVIHFNRAFLAVAYLIVIITNLMEVAPIYRAWIAAILFLALLVSFTISALFNWRVENANISKIIEDPLVHKITIIRHGLHELRQPLSVIITTVNLMCVGRTESEVRDVNAAIVDIQRRLDEVQSNVREIDPTYRGKIS